MYTMCTTHAIREIAHVYKWVLKFTILQNRSTPHYATTCVRRPYHYNCHRDNYHRPERPAFVCKSKKSTWTTTANNYNSYSHFNCAKAFVYFTEELFTGLLARWRALLINVTCPSKHRVPITPVYIQSVAVASST